MADLAEGAVFAGHRIEGVAGRGGMGTVYRATHIALDHMVALKVIAGDLADDDSFRERFKSESRIAVSLRHPNVVPIHHAGEEDGLLFVTMDLIDGPDLRKLLISRGPLEPEPAIAILEQVASALDIAHSRGLVHRDIKPGNILIEERAGSDHAFLTDFGLTKRMDQASEATGLTSTGAFVGTLDYVAPEQIRGEELDARTDVYALGCVLYEMLTAKAPFGDREEKVAKMYAHLQDRPGPLEGRLRPMDDVIARSMAKDREGRFPSAGDLARSAAAAIAGGQPSEEERSVATGPAAPTAAYDVLAGSAAGAGVAAEAGSPSEDTVESPPPAGASRPSDPDLEETVEQATPPESTLVPDAASGPVQRTVADREPALTQPQRAETSGSRRRSRAPLTALLIGLAAAAAVGAVLLAGGDGDGGATATNGTTTNAQAGGPPGQAGDPVGVSGFPVGIAAGAGEVRAVSRQAPAMSEVSAGSASTSALPEPATGAEDVDFTKGTWWATATDANAVVGIANDGGGGVGPVEVGEGPRGIDASGVEVWVANNLGNSLTRLTATAGGATAEPPVDLPDADGPHGVAIDADRNSVWVTSRNNNRLIRVGLDDPAGDQETFDVGANPKGVAATADSVWVANADDETVSRVDPDSGGVVPIKVGGTPRDLVEALGLVWVTNGDGYVTAIDPSSGEAVGRVTLDGAPAEDIAFDEESETLWVTTGGGNTVVPVNPR